MSEKIWKVDLQWLPQATLSDRTLTPDLAVAELAFRRLLAREDLTGQRVAARLVSPHVGASVYYSRFDAEYGKGRIHPASAIWISSISAPNLLVDEGGPPPPEPPVPWQLDQRDFASCLKAWHYKHSWTRAEAASEFSVPKATYDGWCAGRPTPLEGALRRLMTFIDQERLR